MRSLQETAIRVLPELRAVQVEQGLLMTPAMHWFFDTNYDLFETSIPPGFERMSLRRAAWRLLSSNASVLEVPEPLWARFLPQNMTLVVAWRLGGLLRLRNRKARTYAIENNSPSEALFGRSIPWPLDVLVRFALGAFMRIFFERVALGTPAAADSYATLPFFRRIEHSMILGLPTPSLGADEADADPNTAIFVGHLDARKGLPELMIAWSEVEQRLPSASLVVVGAGPLRESVEKWVAARPGSRRYLGQLPHDRILSVVGQAAVVVAPSVRARRWREQVGLPIEEGLSMGRTIVTTSETGLADWLHQHGHSIIASDAPETDLSRALVDALTYPIEPSSVLGSLPTRHGRLVADSWLHRAY
ncbi:glycosyltransferase [Aeromicrobium sp. S22]|nr:glycosyltransferase [Aeromicrobium sp. S22]